MAGAQADEQTNALQNPKVKIAIIAVGVIILLVVVWFLFLSPSGNTSSTSSAGAPVSPGLEGASGGQTGSGAPGLGGAAGAPPGGLGGAPGAGGAPAAGGAGASGQAVTSARGPVPPSRRNPFDPNAEVNEAIGLIVVGTGTTPDVYAPRLDIFRDLNPPRSDVVAEGEDEGPPIPPMRVAGILQGRVVAAILQVGGQTIGPISPGQMVLDTYRLERIEPERVILSRDYEVRGRTKKQVIEVTLAGIPGTAGAGGGAGGFSGGLSGAPMARP